MRHRSIGARTSALALTNAPNLNANRATRAMHSSSDEGLGYICSRFMLRLFSTVMAQESFRTFRNAPTPCNSAHGENSFYLSEIMCHKRSRAEVTAVNRSGMKSLKKGMIDDQSFACATMFTD